MKFARFDSLTSSLSASPSRRGALRLLASSACGGLLGFGALPSAAKKKKKVTLCHSGQTLTVSKKAKKAHLKHGDKLGACAPTQPAPVLTYQCPGPKDIGASGGADTRHAQVFTALQSGSLRQISFSVVKDVGSTGDYVVQLLRVVAGVPGHTVNDVLASAPVPNASVVAGDDATLTASFGGPALVAGTEYAAAYSRPGSSGMRSNIHVGDGNACAGKLFHAEGADPFGERAVEDLLVSVRVI